MIVGADVGVVVESVICTCDMECRGTREATPMLAMMIMTAIAQASTPTADTRRAELRASVVVPRASQLTADGAAGRRVVAASSMFNGEAILR